MALTFGVADTAAAQEASPTVEDVRKRDSLIAAQESLLDVYRCRFNIDTVLISGGCSDGAPARPVPPRTPFDGTPTSRAIEERNALIASQEALLNAYRCMFDIDTGAVSGGCLPKPSEADPVASTPCDFSSHAGNAIESVWQVEAERSLGTAFHLGQAENRHWWLTAEHVVRGQRTAILSHSGRRIAAQVVTADRLGDIAILSTEVGPSAWLQLDGDQPPQPGMTIFAIGYPLYQASTPAVSRGIVSRFLDDPYLGRLLQSDTSVSPGHSGGPMLDACGRVIGMVVSKSAAGNAEGINYSITRPSLQRAWLNAQTQSEQVSGSRSGDDDLLPATARRPNTGDGPELGAWQQGEYADGGRFLWFAAHRDEGDAGVVVFEYPCNADYWNTTFWVWQWDGPVDSGPAYVRVWNDHGISQPVSLAIDLVQHFPDGRARSLLKQPYREGGSRLNSPLRVYAALLDSNREPRAMISYLRTQASDRALTQKLADTRSQVSC